MDERTYTHRDLARELGVSETTIKSYRSKFPAFLPVAREGKPVRLHAEAFDVCRRIRDLFDDGLSILQVQESLRTEFKEYPFNRRLPMMKNVATESVSLAEADPSVGSVSEALTARIEALARGQEAARARMEQLEIEVRNLATMEAASKTMMAELVAELRAARDSAVESASRTASSSGTRPVLPDPSDSSGSLDSLDPGVADSSSSGSSAPPRSGRPAIRPEAHPEVVTARKIVTVHGASGPVASYAFTRESPPAPPFPEPEKPAASFLSLPAVIRSDRGDFLGLPGGQTVRRLVEVLAPKAESGPVGVTWFAEGGDAWTCFIPLGHAQKREILFERTTTPRGNMVGLIRRMRINEAEATPMQLQEIFRQLRDQLT